MRNHRYAGENKILACTYHIVEISEHLKYFHLEISTQKYCQKLYFASKSTHARRSPVSKF